MTAARSAWVRPRERRRFAIRMPSAWRTWPRGGDILGIGRTIGSVPNFRKLKRKSSAKLTPEEHAERKRAIARAIRKRYQKKLGKAERRKRRERDDARCYAWEAVLPHIDKQDDGCWIWTGHFQMTYGQRPRPIVRKGSYGKQFADNVVSCLHRKAPLPPGCFLRRSCGRMECVSPEHLLVTNQSVERAKGRLAHERKQEEARRAAG